MWGTIAAFQAKSEDTAYERCGLEKRLRKWQLSSYLRSSLPQCSFLGTSAPSSSVISSRQMMQVRSAVASSVEVTSAYLKLQKCNA